MADDNTNMTAKLTVDKAGRVVLPKPLREELQLEPGDVLEAETWGQKIILHPVRTTVPLQKEKGVWVYRTGQNLSSAVVDHTIRRVREERARAGLGADR
jgi:AbrB family looped-hinge helix DNA binding protein